MDEILESLQSLRQSQEEDQTAIKRRLDQLEKDVAAGQEDATQRIVKRLKEDQIFIFKKKGNEKQFIFNDNVKDQCVATAKHLELIDVPSGSGQREAIDKAKEELKQGLEMIAARQKRIKVADRSKFGWATVDEYEQDQLAADKEDAKRLEKAEKSAGSKAVKRKKSVGSNRGDNWRRQQGRSAEPIRRFPTPGPPVSIQAPPQAQPFRPRPPGPCWYCSEMGHLKAKLPRPYPLNIECVNEGTSIKDEVGNCGVNKHVNDVYPPVEVRKCDKGIEPLQRLRETTDNNEELSNLQFMGSCEEGSEPDPDLGRYWELEQDGHQVSDVQGRLLANINFWEQVLEAPQHIIDCIKEGYKLPLLSLPEPFKRHNHKSALQDKEFVTQAISDLIHNRCVAKVEDAPLVCSPLSVVVNDSGKKRLVIDLKHVNKYLFKSSFKYEDIRTAMLLFQKEDYLFSFDLKSGYHHVDIHRQHQKYLGFAWDMGEGPRFYIFKVLPFGLATYHMLHFHETFKTTG